MIDWDLYYKLTSFSLFGTFTAYSSNITINIIQNIWKTQASSFILEMILLPFLKYYPKFKNSISKGQIHNIALLKLLSPQDLCDHWYFWNEKELH
jgi:hypothetical protein